MAGEPAQAGSLNVLDGTLVGLLSQLDRARGLVLRRFASSVGALSRDRGRRITLLAATSVTSALVLTLVAPLALLTLGPLLLGVPHLLSDCRYLVVRQGLHRRVGLIPAALCLVLAALQPSWHWGACALVATSLAAHCALRVRALAALVCVAAACVAWAVGPRADVLFAHAHNLVALAFWAIWARDLRAMRLALSLFLVASVIILGGIADACLMRASALTPGAFALAADDLLPGLTPTSDPTRALRWLAFFAFAQAVHYGVWLRVLPEEDRARPAPRTFRASYCALRSDLGLPLLIAAFFVSGALGVWGVLVNAESARENYLRLALFHGPLELMVLLLLGLERRPVRRET